MSWQSLRSSVKARRPRSISRLMTFLKGMLDTKFARPEMRTTARFPKSATYSFAGAMPMTNRSRKLRQISPPVKNRKKGLQKQLNR